VKIQAPDGVEIDARFHVPPGALRGAVLLVPAMGVPQSYYEPLARWLSAEGYAALTFDYRGMGRSRRGPLRDEKADVLDWARLDCEAALNALAGEAPGAPLYWVGHSLGGQILPFVPSRERVAKAITVATGSGYWRENSSALRRRVWFLWYFLAPLTTALFGYFPGSRFGMVGDLPAGVIRQWRRWCLHPDYAVGDGEHMRAQYAAVRTPIVSLSFHDDEFMSLRNTESIHGFYVNAPRTMKRIAAADVGARRIGHFGFFRESFRDSLWRRHLLPELAA
jgi:predicted alpha/beta hydrolase